MTITGKLIVQEIWMEERGWDVEVSPGLRAKVQNLRPIINPIK